MTKYPLTIFKTDYDWYSEIAEKAERVLRESGKEALLHDVHVE